MAGGVGVWDADVREASRRKKASFSLIARGMVNGGSRQSPVVSSWWTLGPERHIFGDVARNAGVATLVVSPQPVIVFEQPGLEHVAQ